MHKCDHNLFIFKITRLHAIPLRNYKYQIKNPMEKFFVSLFSCNIYIKLQTLIYSIYLYIFCLKISEIS